MNDTPQNIETKVADAILQRDECIAINGIDYAIAPPSVATLILASEAIARLPKVKFDESRILEDTLAHAKDCTVIGEVIAILILGAKHINDIVSERRVKKKRLWGILPPVCEVVHERAKKQLARQLLEDVTPKELQRIAGAILAKMQVGDFFGLSTFLIEINLMKTTKVETEAIASGQ